MLRWRAEMEKDASAQRDALLKVCVGVHVGGRRGTMHVSSLLLKGMSLSDSPSQLTSAQLNNIALSCCSIQVVSFGLLR